MSGIVRINLWSGPRNISTAMMYSFGQRSDTQVVDEPLYAHYLKVSGAQHPGRNEVLQSQENEGSKVVEWMMNNKFEKSLIFFKQMTHHLTNLPLDFLSDCKNILLIRNPKEVLVSYAKVIEQLTLADIGIQQNVELWKFLEEKKLHRVIVDSNQLLNNPNFVLRQLCENLGIEFQSSMLHWSAGGRKEDGVWAKYWYKNIHQSTGFAPFEKENQNLPDHLLKIYEEAKPFYDFLYAHSIKS